MSDKNLQEEKVESESTEKVKDKKNKIPDATSDQDTRSESSQATSDDIEKAMLEEAEAASDTKQQSSDPPHPEVSTDATLSESDTHSEEKKESEKSSASQKDKESDPATEAGVQNTSESKEPEEKDKKAPATDSDSDSDSDSDEDDTEEVSSSDEEEKHEEDTEGEKDYHDLTQKQLVAELGKLLKEQPIQNIKSDVEEIRAEFHAKFNETLEHKKEDFLADGGNIIDFHYTTPLKKEFNSLYFDYKEKRNNYYKNLKRDLHANLEKRQELIEELKGLLNAEENINTTYKHFKDIQDRWHVAGPIPRDKYNMVWNTYHHHVENFYDFLHLNREFRDMDFKHNLEQKLKLIGRAEELAQEANINKAFRELQMLHKMWKEDVGPVAKEYREEVWDKFSAATKVIHDKRQEYLQEQEKHFEVNYEVKMKLVEEIKEITDNTKPSHQSWQQAIKKVQQLRDAYFETGKVPRNKTKEVWSTFKDATRTFNRSKNAYYKNQKKEQYVNLEKKKELIKIAEEHKNSEDFDSVTPVMKRIQSEWKQIGHVPRKESDKIWKQFKAACNHYFDRLHADKKEANKEEQEHLEKKKQLLDELNNFKLSGDNKADLSAIKEKIKTWKEVGKVPFYKRSIDRKFNKALDSLFQQLDISKKETELIKFDNKMNSFVSQDDEKKLQNEHFFISKKIGETKNEIRQLENNLGFFQNADSSNPLVKEVHKNIAKHKEQLEVWKAKLAKIKSIRND